MTDRELLELAAKAAGITGLWHERGQCIHVTSCAGMSDMWWRPLEDDGDAMRLSVALGMSVSSCILYYSASTIALSLAGIFIKEEMAYQSCESACRRAIVRAAAEVGRLLP